MPTEVATVCFHTRDAVERDDSSLTFEMPTTHLRTPAAKVTLASCEFPMVQWTIEAGWNRLWLNEGVRLDVDRCELRLVARSASDNSESTTPERLVLPPRLNAVASTVWRNSRLVVTCRNPHGLEDGGVPGALLLLGRHGDQRLDTDVRRESDTVFSCRPVGCAPDGEGARYVLVPPAASPAELCARLQRAAQRVDLRRAAVDKILVGYDAARDTLRIDLVHDGVRPGGFVRVLPSALAQLLGLSSYPVRVESGLTRVPSEPTHVWDYAEVPPGFYGPCHRPLCVGAAPARFGPELEAAFNRLYFPLGEPQAPSLTSPHLLVFTDPEGRVLTCDVPCGRLTPQTLCAYLETAMTRAATAQCEGVSYAVSHEDDRFVFACERKDAAGRVSPAAFGLLWQHPIGVDPDRFGFAAQPLGGQHTYVAPQRTRVPAPCGRAVSNVLRFGEAAAQKRFRLHATAPPPMVALVVEDAQGGALALRTHVNKLVYAHGLTVGDTVRLAPFPSTTLVTDDGETTTKETAARVPTNCTCVVEASDPSEPCLLRLRVPASVPGLRDLGTALQVVCDAEPWNLSFGKPGTLPGHLVGFPSAAVQYGTDGSVGDGDGRRLPPYEAPYSHNLDHPDYVLLTLSEGAGATLESIYGGQTRPVFCKLALYPLFREERMLPRDTALLGARMSRFTLCFLNPDFSPYRFHGAEFSFSLAFFQATPD